MAKYEIKHACGHTETVNICGTNVHGERERKAEWLASKPCYKCQREMDEAAGKTKPEPKDAKQAVFTEQNKRGFPKLLDFMRAWAEKNLTADEYAELFGEPDEDGAAVVATFSLSAAAKARIEREASRTGKSQSAIVEELIGTL